MEMIVNQELETQSSDELILLDVHRNPFPLLGGLIGSHSGGKRFEVIPGLIFRRLATAQTVDEVTLGI